MAYSASLHSLSDQAVYDVTMLTGSTIDPQHWKLNKTNRLGSMSFINKNRNLFFLLQNSDIFKYYILFTMQYIYYLADAIQWSLDLMKCQETRGIGSLYRGSIPYILKGRAGEYRLFYQGLRYTEVR